MTDIRVFRLAESGAHELPPHRAALEREVQGLFENNMLTLLGVRFVRTEKGTGKLHRGRIDSLGIDENATPVIIEYKLHQDPGIMTQGLSYLDWLLDHKAEFEKVAAPQLAAGEEIDWESPRVLCIAEDFRRHDIAAARRMSTSIELIRYRLYRDLVLLESVNESVAPARKSHLKNAEPLRSVSNPTAAALDERIMALGDDVRRKQTKLYVAYRRIKNFACVLSYQHHVLVYVSLEPGVVELESGFLRDMTKLGHLGTGNVEVRLESANDIDRAMVTIQRAYEG